jgi:hypothetical protein
VLVRLEYRRLLRQRPAVDCMSGGILLAHSVAILAVRLGDSTGLPGITSQCGSRHLLMNKYYVLAFGILCFWHSASSVFAFGILCCGIRHSVFWHSASSVFGIPTILGNIATFGSRSCPRAFLTFGGAVLRKCSFISARACVGVVRFFGLVP